MGPSPLTEGDLSRLQSSESGPLGRGAAELNGKDALAAFGFEGVGLKVEVLFAGGDAGVANVHGKRQLFVSDSSLGSLN